MGYQSVAEIDAAIIERQRFVAMVHRAQAHACLNVSFELEIDEEGDHVVNALLEARLRLQRQIATRKAAIGAMTTKAP